MSSMYKEDHSIFWVVLAVVIAVGSVLVDVGLREY